VEPEISEADLLCYAQRYGNLFNVYCQGDVATCDYPGLLHHYENHGISGGKKVGCDAATDAPVKPVEPEISEADLLCYAQRYGNLFDVYCQGNVATCDYPGLLYHYETHGKSGGKKVGCDAATDAPVEPEISEADLVCYAQRYGNLFNAYCQGDVATCNYPGLLHHYENHGKSGGKRVGCDPVVETTEAPVVEPTEDPMKGYTKVGDGFCRGPGGSTVNFVKSEVPMSLADCVSMCDSLSTCVGLSHMGKNGGYCEAYGSMTSASTGWAYRNKAEKTVVSSGSHHGVVCYTKDGSGLCSQNNVAIDDVTKIICENSADVCEVYIKKGTLREVSVQTGNDYCSAIGLECLQQFDDQNGCSRGTEYSSCDATGGTTSDHIIRCGSVPTATSEPTEPGLTRENYICYALRYQHLLTAYCQGSASTCYVDGLKHHFENHGQGNGLSTECTSEFLAIIKGN